MELLTEKLVDKLVSFDKILAILSGIKKADAVLWGSASVFCSVFQFLFSVSCDEKDELSLQNLHKFLSGDGFLLQKVGGDLIELACVGL